MQYKLNEIFDLQMGKTPSRSDESYWNSNDFPWISIGDLSKCNKFIFETKEYITKKAVDETGILLIPANTVIMSFKLSIGKVAVTSKPMFSNEAIMAFRNKGIIEILPEYLYYSLKSMNWEDNTNKAVMGKTLNKASLSNYRISIHEIKTQEKIVDVLDNVQNIINLLSSKVRTLDTFIKARFVEMFGDPKAEVKRFSTLEMPEICEIIDGDRGKNYPSSKDFSDSGFCLFLNAKNVTANGFSFNDCMFISEEKDKALRKGKLSRGDVVLTTRGTIGNLAFYSNNISFENIRINSGMVILRLKQDIINEIFFIELFRLLLQDIKEKVASGSAQPQLPIATMNKINLIIPPLSLQTQFANFVQQVEKSKALVQQSLSQAQLLFDSLMQSYFS